MVESENPRKFPIFWIGLFVLLGMIFVIMWWWLSRRGIKFIKILTYFVWVAFAVLILGAIIFLVLWLLRKQRVDMIHIMKQRIVKACQLCPPKERQQIWFKGSDDLEHRYIGEVVGVAKAKSEPIYEKIIDKEGEESSKQIKDPMDITFIAFKRPVPFPLSLFNTPKIYCGLTWTNNGKTYSDFSHLSANVVYLRGMTFAPELYGIYFLSHHFKDTFMIDEVVKELIYRYGIQDNLSEFKNIVDDALGISPAHQKILEKSKMHQISGGYGVQTQQQPPQQTQ